MELINSPMHGVRVVSGNFVTARPLGATYSHPDTTFAIEDQQNRERQENDNSKDDILPDDPDFINELRLRHQFRFK